VIPHIFLVIAGAAFKLILDYGRLQKRMADTAKEKAEAELNFLKSQINPHFLFNSINSIYFLIDRNNSAAREALHSFSEMLRFQLYEMNDKKIPVEKEIRYLQQYMDLQKLRKDESLRLDFIAAEDVKGFSIEPLLLVPLVENAFKYLSHETGKTPYVNMYMSRENGSLKVMIENSSEKKESVARESGGIGLTNVKRRLELLYPGEHHFEVFQTDHVFRVNLSMKIL
jgi:LytS/YehU family sensor histidine kinase